MGLWGLFMENYCDLHTHSIFSDGTDTPVRLIELAAEAGLSAVALCDHNTVAGLPDFVKAAKDSNVGAVPGVEISTDFADKELHILALFVEPQHYTAVTELLEEGDRRKEQSNIDLVAALNAAGYALSYEQIKAKTPQGHINRAHIAAEMLELGYVESVQAAFQTLLSPKHGLYHPPKRIDAYDAIRFIKSIGAVAVLAHPFLSMEEGLLRAFLPQAVEAGLDAMEVFYSKYDEETTLLAVKIAEEFGILPSGGSDYHGGNKPDISIGTGRGNLKIPSHWLEMLKKRK
jgi:predicted metal-dependent phosphoesterase TrpH